MGQPKVEGRDLHQRRDPVSLQHRSSYQSQPMSSRKRKIALTDLSLISIERIIGKIRKNLTDLFHRITNFQSPFSAPHPDGKTLPAILEENTAVHLADTRLTKEEKEELQEAGCSLGTGDRAMQKANLDRYEARLVQRIAELQKGLPERKRLCQSLGIMGGLFLFLILV